MRNFLFGGAGTASTIGDLGLLVLRVVAGLSMALGHGIKKLPPPEGLMKGVAAMGLPSFMAWAAAFAEFGGGLLIVIGLLIRPSGLLWVCTMTVALIGVHRNDPFAKQELALLYFCIGLFLLLNGSGRFSVDRMIRK